MDKSMRKFSVAGVATLTMISGAHAAAHTPPRGAMYRLAFQPRSVGSFLNQSDCAVAIYRRNNILRGNTFRQRSTKFLPQA